MALSLMGVLFRGIVDLWSGCLNPRPGQPSPPQGCGREVHLLHPAYPRAARALPRLRGDCPVGARKFGNLLDPSEIRYLIERTTGFDFQGRA